MKIVAYYHLHLTEDPLIWTSIFIEQMKCVEDSGLKPRLDSIRINCIAQNNEQLAMLNNLCRSYQIPYRLTAIKNPYPNDDQLLRHRDHYDGCSEDVTLNQIWLDSQNEDMKILYFHSKGSTSYYYNVNPQHIVKHKEYYYWRSLMNWGAITRWDYCEHYLDLDYDTTGCNYLTKPSPHYCGNFWWSKSSHIKKLPDPSNKNWWDRLQSENSELRGLVPRMSDEMWVCSLKGTKSYDIVELPDVNTFSACLTELDYKRCLK